MRENIRDAIVAGRRRRIAELGHAEGADLPARREVPLVRFLERDGIICEVKRRSPSRGAIKQEMDAVEQAGLYIRAGARNLSILTEPEGFGGSLDDLVRVKRAFPGTAVIRKDFLLCPFDVDVAWLAGADAVLLIAGILTAEELVLMHRRAKSLGMEALVEIHDDGDLEKARRAGSDLVGVNSRDLRTFAIDPLLPLKMRAGVDWEARVVYESGVSHPEQAAFAGSAGFDGLLVGEAVVRNPALVGAMREAMRSAAPAAFWSGIGGRLAAAAGRPLVKICGLTRGDDARLAADLGADLLGFVFWPGSKRSAGEAAVRAVRDVGACKVAVTVNPRGAAGLDPVVRTLLADGFLDAVQFHGDEDPDDCGRLWPTYYKAIRAANAGESAAGDAYRCPRLLLDAAADLPGGSGRRVPAEVLDAWRRPLWLAGGINPDNVGGIVAARRPELLDVASGVEKSPGVKDPDAMRRLFGEIKKA